MMCVKQISKTQHPELDFLFPFTADKTHKDVHSVHRESVSATKASFRNDKEIKKDKHWQAAGGKVKNIKAAVSNVDSLSRHLTPLVVQLRFPNLPEHDTLPNPSSEQSPGNFVSSNPRIIQWGEFLAAIFAAL